MQEVSAPNLQPTLSYYPLAAPGEDPGRPTSIDFLVTGSFNIKNTEGRRASRNSASSYEEITIASENDKIRDYRLKVHTAWKCAFPGVPCPGSETDAPLPASGLAEVTGFEFCGAIFDTFGGCSEGIADLLMSSAKRVADFQGSSHKRVFDRVYGRLSYCIWSPNAHL